MVKRGLVLIVWGLWALTLGYPSFALGAGVHLSLGPPDIEVDPGDTVLVQVVADPADAQFNAFYLVLGFDPTRLSLVPTTPIRNQIGPVMTDACSNIFHVFTPRDTEVVADVGLLCSETYVTGPGAIYRVKFRAGEVVGPTQIGCNPGTQFYRAGMYVNPLDSQPMTVWIGTSASVTEPGRPGGRHILDPPRPNPWSGKGPVTFAFILARPSAACLEVFDVQGARVAWRESLFTSPGRQVLNWQPARLPSGTYWVRLRTDSGTTQGRKWTVLR